MGEVDDGIGFVSSGIGVFRVRRIIVGGLGVEGAFGEAGEVGGGNDGVFEEGLEIAVLGALESRRSLGEFLGDKREALRQSPNVLGFPPARYHFCFLFLL